MSAPGVRIVTNDISYFIISSSSLWAQFWANAVISEKRHGLYSQHL